MGKTNVTAIFTGQTDRRAPSQGRLDGASIRFITESTSVNGVRMVIAGSAVPIPLSNG